MPFLPVIPRDPPARLRLLSYWFVLFAVGVDLVETAISHPSPLPLELAGAAAIVALGAWLTVGYRRGRFPEFSTPVEAVLLVIVTAGASLPLRAMGMYLAALMFRALYLTRREFWLLPVSYGIARIIGIAVTVKPAPYGPFSMTVLIQIMGLTFIAAILFLLNQAMEGQARAELQLREAQKMEAVGQLAGGIAHDFNNLLTVIGGHVFMVEQHATLGPDAARHLDGITQTAERAGSLTKQLLAFGRRQRLHPTTVDLNAVVRDAARLLGPVVGERIRVVCEFDPALEPVRADVGQLEQVLLNLGLNARDAMPDGGTLRIGTANIDSPSGRLAAVTFEDTGIGMNAHTLAHLFEPFFTTKSGGRGTGLGLATAYGIIKQSSGDITATSQPGRGSVFTITLPVVAHAESASSTPVDRALPMAESLGVSRVLLVEDNEGVRDFAREVLTRAGAQVWLASDGAEGLDVARIQGYAFDLVVTDIVMPELTGPQMVERLREARPELRVLFVTGYSDDPVTRQSMRPGREALIEKPFTARALREAIHSLAAARPEAAIPA